MNTTLHLSLAEYDAMIADGAFAVLRDRRIELVFGELREMTPPGPTHSEVIDLVTRWSVLSVPPRKIRVRVQNPISIPQADSAPQPDISWIVERDYRHRNPLPAEVLLVIEVSDSSLEYDRTEKAALYAVAGIREYWIVNVPEFQIEVYREPLHGEYTKQQTFQIGDSIRPLSTRGVRLEVASLFR